MDPSSEFAKEAPGARTMSSKNALKMQGSRKKIETRGGAAPPELHAMPYPTRHGRGVVCGDYDTYFASSNPGLAIYFCDLHFAFPGSGNAIFALQYHL